MRIEWHVKCKFRAFGITFGTVDRSGTETLPIPPLGVQIDRVLHDANGLYLHVRVA